jgi:hypothetical protein
MGWLARSWVLSHTVVVVLLHSVISPASLDTPFNLIYNGYKFVIITV